MNLYATEFGVAVQTAHGLLPVLHIMGIGRNYREHAHEQGASAPQRPMVFTKNPMAATLHGREIVVPRVCQGPPCPWPGQVDFEGELAVILGRAARDVGREEALEFVLGYCCANDVTARWWQREGAGGQFCRGKSFDTFCPLGPRVAPAAEIGDPQGLTLTSRVNGREMQRASTGEMIFAVAELISELSRGTTLLPGTVILTGTPAGVGASRTPPEYLRDGDVVEVQIEGIGVLRNRVVFEGG